MKKALFFVISLSVLPLACLQARADDAHAVQADTATIQAKESQELKLRFFLSDDISRKPVSGRIIVGFHRDLSAPVNNPDPFSPQPTFAWEVRDWRPGEALVLDSRGAVSWHGDLATLNGWYAVQAALKVNRSSRSLRAPGNAVTAKSVVYVEKGEMCRPLDLLFHIPAPKPRKLEESEFVKLAEIPSPLLTRFYGEEQAIQAAVILPPGYYQEPRRLYPSVYVMGGWGSTHLDGPSGEQRKRYGMAGFGEEKVFVFVNGESPHGYHVFCDSEANGPREQTFFAELIPFIEKNFRVDRRPAARFLAGQSTGAWAALWLLVRRPGQFGGAFAGSPDPVDFREFTGTNVYEKGANLFVDAAGNDKCFTIPEGPGGNPLVITIRDFAGIDRIAGWGEQMDSFDAAFSGLGVDGSPRRLCDWQTGKVDPAVAVSWRRHDLSRVISALSRSRIKELQGKIHVYVADHDPFHLGGPVKRFQRIVAGRGLRADIRILPGSSHAVWNDELRKDMHEAMDRIVRTATAPPAGC
jgi:pimeloyl-ACP methyl ester carboxylesterase